MAGTAADEEMKDETQQKFLLINQGQAQTHAAEIDETLNSLKQKEATALEANKSLTPQIRSNFQKPWGMGESSSDEEEDLNPMKGVTDE